MLLFFSLPLSFFFLLFNTKSTGICPYLFLSKTEKVVEIKMDPVFEHPVFDSAREKMERFIRHLEKSQEAFEN